MVVSLTIELIGTTLSLRARKLKCVAQQKRKTHLTMWPLNFLVSSIQRSCDLFQVLKRVATKGFNLWMIWRGKLLPEMALNVVLNHMLVPHWSSLQGYVRIESRPCLSKNYLRLATWSTGVVFDQFVAMSSAGQSVPHASRTWRGFVLKDPNGFAMIIKLDFCCQHFEFMLTRVLDLSKLNLEDFLYFAAKFVTGISIGI